MTLDLWDITEHVIPAAHIRGYARGVRDEATAQLRLAVKQYAPRSNFPPIDGDATLIMVHGISSAKECYEPFFDDLLSRMPRIRNIWAVDGVHSGASYMLNRDVIGDEIHWFDFSRDIWQTINYFQQQMPPPIIGMGQSLGAAHLTALSLWHPRLFSGLVFLEPGLGPGSGKKWPRPDKYFPGVIAAKRRDEWPSRDAARKVLAKSSYYGAFDPRVFERMIKYELTEDFGQARVAMAEAQGSAAPPVTLTTPKTMETYVWLRPNPGLAGFPIGPEDNTPLSDSEAFPGFGRPEGPKTWASLPHIYPPVLLVWGELSELSPGRNRIVNPLGTGVGGGGGKANGQVTEAIVNGAHHTVSLEKPEQCAAAVAEWLKQQLERWKEEAESRKNQPGFDNTRVHRELLDRLEKL